jgi:hypothetical protein
MKKIVPGLAVALVIGLGASSSAQAAVHTIDFSAGVLSSGGGTLSYTSGSTLDKSTAFDFDGTTLDVTSVGSDDTTGNTAGTTVTISPANIMYGPSATGPASLPGTGIVKSWTIAGDTYTEKLTEVESISRSKNAITVTLSGEVTDTSGMFDMTPAIMQLAATQVGGEGASISVSLTNFAKTSVVPEPSTWVMMTLGFVGLGYAATRRGKANTAMLSV